MESRPTKAVYDKERVSLHACIHGREWNPDLRKQEGISVVTLGAMVYVAPYHFALCVFY